MPFFVVDFHLFVASSCVAILIALIAFFFALYQILLDIFLVCSVNIRDFGVPLFVACLSPIVV